MIKSTDISNKATYVDCLVTTQGGSAFKLAARLGGQYISEKRIVGRLKKDPVGTLKEYAALGTNGVATCKITMTAKGDDLDIGPTGCTVRPPAVPAKGTVTKGSRD